MDYYSLIKHKEILSYAAMQMNLQSIMLAEINQHRRTKLHDITYMIYLKYSNSLKHWMVVARE